MANERRHVVQQVKHVVGDVEHDMLREMEITIVHVFANKLVGAVVLRIVHMPVEQGDTHVVDLGLRCSYACDVQG